MSSAAAASSAEHHHHHHHQQWPSSSSSSLTSAPSAPSASPRQRPPPFTAPHNVTAVALPSTVLQAQQQAVQPVTAPVRSKQLPSSSPLPYLEASGGGNQHAGIPGAGLGLGSHPPYDAGSMGEVQEGRGDALVRDIAARIIQTHWRMWKDWKKKVGKKVGISVWMMWMKVWRKVGEELCVHIMDCMLLCLRGLVK